MQVSRWCATALSCAVGAFGLVACGDDDDGGDTGAAAGAAATTTASAPAADGPSQESVDYGVQYTGGTAGKADDSLDPVTIGFIDQTGGTPSFPEHAAAAAATVKFVNEQLGGIQGHPLKLETCTMLSEEDGQKCGAQMRSAEVPLINLSLATAGNASLYKTVSPEIPVLTTVPIAPQDSATAGGYVLNGGGFATLYAMAKDAQNIQAKNVAMISSGNQGGKFAMEQVAEPSLDALKVKHGKIVYFKDDATTPDMTSALQAAGGSKADVIYFIAATPQNCISFWDAAKQLGVKARVVVNQICNADIFVDHTGSGPEGWRMWSFGGNPRVTDSPEIKAYIDVMTSYDAEKWINVGFGPITASDILTIAKLANQIGPDKLTPEAFTEAIRAFRGPQWLVPGTPRCDDPPTPAALSICGDESGGSAFEGGAWKDLEPIKAAASS